MVLYGALLVAAAATYGAYNMITTLQAKSKVPMRTVVVAAKDVPEGTLLDRIDLAVRQWPSGTAPEGAFTSMDSVIGRVVRVPVFAGEAIVPGRLAPTGSSAGLETKIPPGLRAMAVRINDVAGISGLLQPNSRVDVLVTLSEGNNTENQVAKLFMENMRVLSVGTEVQRTKDGKPNNATTVTLGVTPDEAERLAVAMNRGSIQLVLRGYGDPDTIRTRGATSRDVLAQLRGTPVSDAASNKGSTPKRAVRRVAPTQHPVTTVQAPPPPPAPPESLKVDIYRGDKTTRQAFEKSPAGVATSGGR